MGLGDKLKSWFVIEEEGSASDKKASKTEQPETKSSETPQSSANKSAASSTQVSAGKVSSKFMEVLLAAMEKNNLDGFDYLEFKESLKSLEAMPMDEATRYKSAFAMAKTMGATPKQLMQTAGHYVSVLEQEKNKFGQALADQRSKQIGNREDQMKQLEASIQQKAEHIKKLTIEIEENQKALSGMQEEISSATVKVESTKNDFIASFNALMAMIQKDVDNMQKYLK